MDVKNLLTAAFGVLLAVAAVFITYRFVAPLTVAVFVYYSTRPFYRKLRGLRIPSRMRAAVVIILFTIPIISLVGYTFLLILSELHRLALEYELLELLGENAAFLRSFSELRGLTPTGIAEAYRAGELDAVIGFLSTQVPFFFDLVSSLFVNLMIVIIATYYLLVDGWRVRELLLRYDDDGVLRGYFEAADEELSAAFVGNFLNIVVISAVAMAVFIGYNGVAPANAEVPFPVLAGALTGVASLIPVIGMKIVYVPLAAVAGGGSLLAGDASVVAYLVGFLFVTLVLVDTIPDIFLRPYLSGDCTHVGLLMLAYIFGPIVFGFHGLFLAPLILLLGVTFFYNVLPHLMDAETGRASGTDGNQSRLDDYAG